MSKKKKISKRTLARLGNDYAMLMGYRLVSNGRWRSKAGGIYTTAHIGKIIATIKDFIADGNSLNVDEIRRVNRGCPLNHRSMI